MLITIVAVGKKHKAWVAEGIGGYEKRLKPPFNIEWVLLPHSSLEGMRARQEESQALLARLKDDDFVILLDETGRQVTSPQLAAQLEQQFVGSRRVVLVIGGAYGVDETLMARADTVWSLSELVFPHQLVRLILAEQLYRAQEIARGGSYHHA